MLTVALNQDSTNPLDLLEELVHANDWSFDRVNDSELSIDLTGRWSDYHMCVVWERRLGAVYFSCHFDARIPQHKRGVVCELLAAANERLWLGHFDLCAEEGLAMFRHTIPLRGAARASVEQLEDLVDTAVLECERFYPALQLVVWGGQPVSSALMAALMDTEGEA